MSLVDVRTYDIKESKDGFKIPVVNDVYIHSIYDPIKESKNLLKQHEESLKKKSHILVLGLGYGYHVQEIIHYYTSQNRTFQIAVIEPNTQVFEDCFKFNPSLSDEIKVYSYPSIEHLFHTPSLISFLLKKPYIIPHIASFNLYRDYFVAYLKHRSSPKIADAIELIEDVETKKYFQFCDGNFSIMGYLDQIKKSKRFNEDIEFPLAALSQMLSEQEASHYE